jgi:hypothetical protein
MKLANLIDPRFKQALTKLNQQQLPLKVAFKLKGAINSVDAELKKYEEVRMSALQKYGKKNEDGSLAADENGNIPLEGDSAQNFVAELNELLSLEIELPKFTLSELGDKVTMSSEELFLLDFISE